MSEKVYNKHIIIIVAWPSVQYRVEWMRSYHQISWDANDLIHSTWYSMPDPGTIMIMCIYYPYVVYISSKGSGKTAQLQQNI